MKAAQDRTVIIIAGPTAVGKTSIAIEVAEHFKTEIISADSRQCYKELNIGVARPSATELEEIKHHFIATHSIHEQVTAEVFEKYALQKLNELFQLHQYVVVTGGTGLYIRALCEGLDEVPLVPAHIRNEINEQYKKHGLEWLQQQVRSLDPEFYSSGENKNPRRLSRALEIMKATGFSVLHFRERDKVKRDFKIIKICLSIPKELLHHHIDSRVDKMVEQGLEEEVRSLIPYRHLNALQTVGYRELFDFFDGAVSHKDAIYNIKINTRQYAKRQLTWFRKDKEYAWFEPGVENMIKFVAGKVKM